MKARFTTIKFFLIQHLFVVGLVLLFVVLSLCSCGRASADGMEQSYRDYIHSVIGDDWTVEQWDTVDSYMDSMPYFMLFPRTDFVGDYVLVLLPYGSNEYFEAYKNNGYSSIQHVSVSEPQIMPWFEKFTSENWETTSCFYFGYDYGGLMPYSLGQLTWSSSRTQYSYCIFDTWDNSLGTYGFGVELSDRMYSDSSWNFYWYNRILRGKSGFYGSNGTFDATVDFPNIKTNYNALFIAHSYTGFRYIEQNVFPVTYTEDSRLKFSTSLRGDGEKLLNIDLSDFVHWGPADDQNISDLVLTLDCDGTEIQYELDDTNSEIVNTKNPNYSKRCVYITPYSEFGLDDYEDVTIVKCDFVHTDDNLMGTVVTDYHIACNYMLKNETSPIESEEIEYDDDTETVKVTTAEITSKNDVVNMQNYYYSYTGGGGEELVIPEGFTVKIVTCVDNTSLADAINQLVSWSLLYNSFGALYDIGEAAVLEVSSISNSDDFLAFMEDEIKANSYGDYYDIVCYYYCPDAVSAEVDQFYYYITSSGKLRTVNQTLADIWVESNQTAYNTAAIYDFLFTRLNDFEDKSLEAFNDMIALDSQRNSWLSTINSGISNLIQTSYNGFVNVVSAINNIDIPEPTVFDDTDIIDKLDDLITAFQHLLDGNEVDTPQECIQYYYDNQNGTIDLAFVPAYYEGMTLDFLYSIQGETQNNNRSGTKSGGGSATFVNDSLIIQIFQQFKDSFTQNYIPQNIRVFLSNITNDTGNHMYYFHLFHNDYDPDEFDGMAD